MGCSSFSNWRECFINDALNTFMAIWRRAYSKWSFRLREETILWAILSWAIAARDLWYALSHRQDNTYHGLCYTSRGALAGTRSSSTGPPWRFHKCTSTIWYYVRIPFVTIYFSCTSSKWAISRSSQDFITPLIKAFCLKCRLYLET